MNNKSELSSPIVIKLNKSQLKKIQPVVNKMFKAYGQDKPGMILAQIQDSGITKVFFVDNKMCKKIQKITHKKE